MSRKSERKRKCEATQQPINGKVLNMQDWRNRPLDREVRNTISIMSQQNGYSNGMRAWVPSFLRLVFTIEASGIKDPVASEQYILEQEAALFSNGQNIYSSLASCFWLNFDINSQEGDRFLLLLGEVIANLPYNIFLSLFTDRCTFLFALTSHSGVSFSNYKEIKSSKNPTGRVIEINFSYDEIMLRSEDAIKGAIVHAIARLTDPDKYYNSPVETDKVKDLADVIGVYWGFQKEIQAFEVAERGFYYNITITPD